MIELDIHICSSGEIVVIHDDSVDRTTDGKGRISDLDWNVLRDLDAGSGEKIPSLKEIMDHFRGRVGLNIELKGRSTALPLWRMLETELKERRWFERDLLVSSFRPDELFEFSGVSGSIRTGIIFEDHPKMGLKFAKEMRNWSVHPRVDHVDEEFMKEARSSGLNVLAWTVNDVKTFHRMQALDVDGMFTDRPDLTNFKGEGN